MLEDMFLIRAACNAASAELQANRAANAAQSAADRLVQLDQRLGAIELALETLVRALIASGHITEEQFLKLAREVDAEDGVIDGRRDLSSWRKRCPNCGRANSGRKQRCIWCETDLTQTKPTPE